MKIKSVIAREILDSRGVPTVETKVETEGGFVGVASVPSGVSIGKYEAIELRDSDMTRYNGMGVLKAVENVNKIIGSAVIGMEVRNQLAIDRLLIKLGGTSDKSKLGANATLSVSQGVCEAAAACERVANYVHVSHLYGLKPSEFKIPTPTFNLINGGKHGAGNLDFQEFHVIPIAGKKYADKLRIAEEIYQSVKKVLIQHGAVHSVGDEGGFAPNLFTNMDALEILTKAIGATPYQFKKDVLFGLDVAATHFYSNGAYRIKDRTTSLTATDFIDYFQELNRQYPLLLLEDPLSEADWEGWQRISQELSETIIVGDDLLATNKSRVQEAITKKACGAILVKPNQIGTIAETIEVIKICRQAGWKVIVSHRSGETTDDFIADFAVGVGADYVKFGAPARGERVVKYNRLLEIETEISN